MKNIVRLANQFILLRGVDRLPLDMERLRMLCAAEAERLEREEISKAFGGSIKLDTMTDDEIEMIKSILK